MQARVFLICIQNHSSFTAGAAAMEHWGCITYYKPYFISVDATGAYKLKESIF